MDTASANIGSGGEGSTPPEGDSYAPGDARVPKVLGKKKRRKRLSRFKKWLKESVEAGYEITGPYKLGSEICWKFNADGNLYEISFEHVKSGDRPNDETYEIATVANNKFDTPKNLTNPSKILNTRRRILKEFITHYSPKTIISKPMNFKLGKLWYTTFKRWGYNPIVYQDKWGKDIIQINLR